MERLTRIFLLLLFVLPASVWAQGQPAPLYEVRATWLTTVWRLDWPPAGGSQVQEQRLREIIRNIKNLGMNTVMFQVVSHGEAMYPSERLPWSNWLTGTPGKDPGFDPLAVAIDEAHRIGIEVHAWINVHHVAAATSKISPTAEPVHVRFAHPEWVVEHTDGSYWGNPAVPEFRAWQVGNVLEMVRNYDLDAVHFDYMRYPGKAGLAGDAEYMKQYPNGAGTLAQWRRTNVTLFVRDVYNAVKNEKPWVKVGAAPIGAYKYYSGAPPANWGWDDNYQEAHEWLREGNMDYVSPQLYFTIGSSPNPGVSHPSPDHVRWVKDWLASAHDRHVYIGQGTWLETAEKRFPAGEIASQISVARSEQAQGQVQFRYSHTTGAPFGGQYAQPSLPPPMPWLINAAAPSRPDEVAIDFNADSRTITLRWQPSQPGTADPLRRYAIFRREGGTPSLEQAEDLVAFVGAQDTSWVEVFSQTPAAPVAYRVVAQSLLGFVSQGSDVVSTSATTLSTHEASRQAGLILEVPRPNPAATTTEIVFTLTRPGSVEMHVSDLLGRLVATPVSGFYAAGVHEATVDASALTPGLYLIALTTEAERVIQRLVVAR